MEKLKPSHVVGDTVYYMNNKAPQVGVIERVDAYQTENMTRILYHIRGLGHTVQEGEVWGDFQTFQAKKVQKLRERYESDKKAFRELKKKKPQD